MDKYRMQRLQLPILRPVVDERPIQDLEIAPGICVGSNYPCFIMAEFGANHQGRYDIARMLVKTAKEAGADCVSFEKSDLESRFTYKALQAPCIENGFRECTVQLELSNIDLVSLKDYANSLGILFTAAGHDKPSVDFLNEIGIPFFKIAPADCSNISFCEYVASLGKPIIICTGIVEINVVEKVYDAVKKINEKICLMHCTCAFPTPPDEAHLNVVKTYKNLFPDAVTGYSGLEVGIGLTLAAVTNGANIVERHLTISRQETTSLEQEASLEPEEFKDMVIEIRNITEAMGCPVKEFQDAEHDCYEKLGKAVVANKDLPAGTILTEEMLAVKVTDEKGWRPEEYESLIGQKLRNDLEEDESIYSEDLEDVEYSS